MAAKKKAAEAVAKVATIGAPAGMVEVAPPLARVAKAAAEGTSVAPVYVQGPTTEADWFSTASTPEETVTRSKSK